MSADDMHEPISLAQVEQKILEIQSLLEQATHAGKQRWEADAQADHKYDVEFAKAALLAKAGKLDEDQEKGDSDQTAKWRATVHCDELLLERNIAKARLESAREAGRNFRASLEGLRSINSNVRQLTVADG